MASELNSPIIIIGAARSGTNMLRNALCALPGPRTWPCDELPFVWRYGNESFRSDCLERKHATPAVREYVRGFFARGERKLCTRNLVEKTCANSLRVGFVDAILPEARFIVIVRDGLDALASAIPRWRARIDWRYSLKKAQYVPLRSIVPASLQVIKNRLHRRARIARWGPRFEGIERLAASVPLHVVCAHQWAECVSSTDRDIATVAENRVLRVTYERLVADGAEQLGTIVEWLGIRADMQSVEQAAATVLSGSVGKGRRSLTLAERSEVEPIIAEAMLRHGYSLRDLQ